LFCTTITDLCSLPFNVAELNNFPHTINLIYVFLYGYPRRTSGIPISVDDQLLQTKDVTTALRERGSRRFAEYVSSLRQAHRKRPKIFIG